MFYIHQAHKRPIGRRIKLPFHSPSSRKVVNASRYSLQFLKGPLAKGLAVMLLSFALFGIQSILIGGSDDTIATVDGEKISESRLRDTVNKRMGRLAAMLGQEFDPTELDQERIEAEALSFLISEKILSNFISELELAVADSELGKEIS